MRLTSCTAHIRIPITRQGQVTEERQRARNLLGHRVSTGQSNHLSCDKDLDRVRDVTQFGEEIVALSEQFPNDANTVLE